MKITLEVSDLNEGTDSPWWIIVNPKMMMSGPHCIPDMITGPFFSRESAEQHLSSRRYAFGKNAYVYCCSGYWSGEYKEAYREAENKSKESENE